MTVISVTQHGDSDTTSNDEVIISATCHSTQPASTTPLPGPSTSAVPGPSTSLVAQPSTVGRGRQRKMPCKRPTLQRTSTPKKQSKCLHLPSAFVQKKKQTQKPTASSSDSEDIDDISPVKKIPCRFTADCFDDWQEDAVDSDSDLDYVPLSMDDSDSDTADEKVHHVTELTSDSVNPDDPDPVPQPPDDLPQAAVDVQQHLMMLHNHQRYTI